MKFGLNFGLNSGYSNATIPDILYWKSELSESWVDEHGAKWYIG